MSHAAPVRRLSRLAPARFGGEIVRQRIPRVVVTNQDYDITRALQQAVAGDRSALGEAFAHVYDRVREMARRELQRERGDHTLTPTALANEAFLRLDGLERIDWRGRAHFLGACAQTMRRVLVDHARSRQRIKRGSGARPVTLENLLIAADDRPDDLLALDDALARLEVRNPRQARIVECRYFAGMEIEETAEALGISPATVKRDWTVARAWLNRELAP